jgi:DNA-binding CsgD family transcriptional regulator
MPTAPGPLPGPAQPAALAGRERELAALGAALDDARAGHDAVVVLSGEAGIGKSALLDAIAVRAAGAGFAVLRGRATEQERDVPFALAVDALDEDAGALGPGRAAALAPELGAVLPSLATCAAEPEAVTAAQRFRLHRALRELLEELARPAPILLALDDLHWADEASLEWVLHALRRPARCAHVLVLALRAVEPLPRLLEAARGRPHVAHVPVGPLAAAAADHLVAGLPAARRRRVVAEARGNPLFLQGLVRAARGDALFLPPDVAAVVELEARALPPASRALLDGAAVVGDPFEPALAAAAAGLGDDALVALDALVAADLVRPVGAVLRFRHPLVRQTLHDAMPPGRRAAAHARVAVALAARGVGPAVLAPHVEASAVVGDAAAAATLAAAAFASAASAPATAARWFAAALRLRPGAGPDERLPLLAGRAQALGAAGRPAEAHAVLLEVLDLLAGAPPAARAELVATTAAVEHLLGRHDVAVRRLDRALAELGDDASAVRARLELELAVGALFHVDLDRLGRFAGRSAAALRATEPALAAADDALAVIAAAWQGHADTVPERLARMRAGLAALDRAALAARPEAAYYAGAAELFTEHVREAVAVAARGLEAVRAGSQDRFLVPLVTMHAMAASTVGDQATAAASATLAEEAARLAGVDYGLQWALWTRAMVAHLRGERDERVRAAAECEEVFARLGDLMLTRVGRCNLATLLVGEDPERAAETITRTAGPELDRLDHTWWSYIGAALVRALLALGRLDAAAATAAVLERRADALALPMTRARALQARAELALARDEPAAAVGPARAAVAIADERGYGVDAFGAQLTLGRAIGRTGDRDEAVAVLRAAAERAAAGQAWGLRDEAARDLRRLGARLPGEVRLAGDDTLSDRERQVAELAAAGRSNREVAATLFLSRKTVEHTLTRVYAKLGVRSRVELRPALERR